MRSRIKLSLAAALLFLPLAAGATPATADAGTPPRRFDLQSRFWVSLHQTLLEAAQRGPIENPGRTPEERAAWEQAVAAYRAHFGSRDSVHDDELIDINDALSRLAGDDPQPVLPQDLRAVVPKAGEVYRRRRWLDDDRSNRFWIAVAAAMLEQAGEELVKAHEQAYGAPYPAHVVVDVAPYGGEFGAYTTSNNNFVHTTVSSLDPSSQGLAALEVLFHESSHAVVGPAWGAIGPEISAAARAIHRVAPRQLWHAVIFYTAGELTRRALAARGIHYQPYAVAGRMYDGPFRGMREPLELDWQTYLDGKLTRAEAIARLVAATSSPPAGGAGKTP